MGSIYYGDIPYSGGSGGGGAWGEITGTLSDQTDLQTALNGKVDTVSGKGLSTNDYDNTAKNTVDSIPLTIQQLQGSLATKQNINLSVPIEMLSGTKLTVEDALQGFHAEKITGIELLPNQYDILPYQQKADSSKAYFTMNDSWETMTWSGITTFQGRYIWTDGTNIYHSYNYNNYVLDGTTWKTKAWYGLPIALNGENVWTDGTNIYFSGGSDYQYKLIDENTWEAVTWSGATDIGGIGIWTDGTNIYYSYENEQFKLNGTTWETMTWVGGPENLYGEYIWTDGIKISHSVGVNTYKLKSTNEEYIWEPISWPGIEGIYNGNNVWTDGTDIYYSASTSIHYKFLKGNTTIHYRNVSYGDSDNLWGSITGTLSNQTDLQNALDSKVNTVSGKGLSTNDYDNTAKNIVDTIPLTIQQLQGSLANKQDTLTFDNTPTSGSNNPVKSSGIETAIKNSQEESTDMLNNTVGWTAINVLPILDTVETTTIDGITFTVTRNAKNEVTRIRANGTSTSLIEFDISSNISVNKDSILTGCPSAEIPLCSLNLISMNPMQSGSFTDFGEGVTITKNLSSARVYIEIPYDFTATDLDFYPMLRESYIGPTAFEPYHKTVDERLSEVHGHDMIPVNNDITTVAALTNGNDNYVINAYTAKRWSNVDTISLLTTATKGTDTIGTWIDDWKAAGASRSGWLWDKDLYDILNDDDIEIVPIFDVANSEVVSLYALRIDDEVYKAVTPAGTENPQEEGWYESDGQTPPTYTLTTDTSIQSGKTYYDVGGAVAFKFNGKIKSNSGVKVGLNLKHQRTNVKNFTVLS